MALSFYTADPFYFLQRADINIHCLPQLPPPQKKKFLIRTSHTSTFQCENHVYATAQKLEPVISMGCIFSVTGGKAGVQSQLHHPVYLLWLVTSRNVSFICERNCLADLRSLGQSANVCTRDDHYRQDLCPVKPSVWAPTVK